MVGIDGHEGQVAGVGVSDFPGEEVLSLHPDPDLHRGPAHIVHPGFAGDHFTRENGLFEIHPIEGDGDTGDTGVPHGGDPRRSVDHGQNHATEHMPVVVHLVGHHQL
jgi:hypothetical protein